MMRRGERVGIAGRVLKILVAGRRRHQDGRAVRTFHGILHRNLRALGAARCAAPSSAATSASPRPGSACRRRCCAGARQAPLPVPVAVPAA